MNINKFTQKSIESVNQCEKIAYDYGNQEIDQEHFLYSLLTIEDSLIRQLIQKMDINETIFFTISLFDLILVNILSSLCISISTSSI